MRGERVNVVEFIFGAVYWVIVVGGYFPFVKVIKGLGIVPCEFVCFFN